MNLLIERRIIFLRILFLIIYFTAEVDCACNFGGDPSSHIDVIESCSSCQYIIPAYGSSCCGSLSRVKFWSSNYGLIDFQVWKETAPNVYELTHTFNYYVPEVNATLTVYTGNDILIEKNDVIGWYSSGDDIIPYSITTVDQNIQLSGVPGFSVGGTYTLNTPYITGRNYGIQFSVADCEIHTGGTLNYGTYTVTIEITDPCGRSQQKNLIVTVINTPPEILNLPSSVDVSESIQHETLLYALTLRNETGSDTVTCSLNTTSPEGAPFLVKYISGTADFGVYSLASPNFDYDSNSSFEVVVDCTDSITTASESLFVYLIKNSEPVVHNLPNVITISSSTPVGTIVFAVNSTDHENDQLTHSLNYCIKCPFTISQSGHIFLKTSIKDASKFSYNLYIVVSDKYGTVTDKLLTILVTGVNSVPVVSNLDQTVNVPKTVAIGTVIFTAIVSDADGDPLSYQYEYDPVETMWKFSMDETTGKISVIEALDFGADIALYKFSFTVNDGKASAPKATLSIIIQSRNEPPEFAHQVYHVSRDEAKSGSKFADPGFVVSDPDAGDTWTYEIADGDDFGRFSIDASTGILQFRTDYIVDKPESMQPSVVLIIAAVDTQGTSGTTTLSVHISDANNKTPYFPSNQYHVTVIYDVPVTSSVAYITALDDDFGPTYNQISYHIESILDHQYFDIDGNALLTTAKSLRQFENGTKLLTLIKATDKGNRQSSVTVTVNVVPGTSNSFFDDPETVAWFAALMTLLVILLGAAVIGLYRYCKYGYVFSKRGLCTSCDGKKVHFEKGGNYEKADTDRRDSRVSISEWSGDNGDVTMWMPSKFDSWNQRANTRGLPAVVEL
ncbi:protocadherin-23-like [Crassostrea angulata]|uniref:protocadherin-23-like n=1 Tax=Magallana angulata TaxID=2784310 RepID=UPI0022B12DD5|nr:protocadherin-23-like [Crassostrea angulata]